MAGKKIHCPTRPSASGFKSGRSELCTRVLLTRPSRSITPRTTTSESGPRAPEEIIDGEREKREEAEGRRAKILEALERLKGAV